MAHANAQRQPEGLAQAAGLSLGRGSPLAEKDALFYCQVLPYPRSTVGASPPVPSAEQGSRPTKAERVRYRPAPQRAPHNSALSLRPVNMWVHGPGRGEGTLPGRIAGVFKLPHQQDIEPGACHPSGLFAICGS